MVAMGRGGAEVNRFPSAPPNARVARQGILAPARPGAVSTAESGGLCCESMEAQSVQGDPRRARSWVLVVMFDALHSRHKATHAMLYAFDLLELNGEEHRVQ